MATNSLSELLRDPRLSLTKEEIVSLNLMISTDAIHLLKYAIENGFFAIDFDHGPEPALSNFYSIFYKLPDSSKAVYN